MTSNGRAATGARICMARAEGGWRGAGLGNQIFPWAKAYLAARELGFGLLRPPFGLNSREYRREFGAARLDWLGHATLRTVLPSVTVTEEMVRSTGRTDYGAAIRALDAEHGWSRRRSLVLEHGGMSGGYFGIARARDFLRDTLLGGRAQASGHQAGPRTDRVKVAVHLRLGDFGESTAGPGPGVFNQCLPVQWYRSVLGALADRLAGTLQVDLVSDDPAGAARLLPEWARDGARPRSTLEDLSVMAAADLLVCSVSSFSMLAAFLSDAPYIWYRPQLSERVGFLSIWGHEPAQQTGPTASHTEAERQGAAELPARGVALASGDEVPRWLADYLTLRLALRRPSADLIHYGVVPTHLG
jgi:hypothetical protein